MQLCLQAGGLSLCLFLNEDLSLRAEWWLSAQPGHPRVFPSLISFRS